MGAASFLKMNLTQLNYGVISRQPSASTATGYNKVHLQEQGEIIETAFSTVSYTHLDVYKRQQPDLPTIPIGSANSGLTG